VQAIPPSAKFFATADCVHGYFQLTVDEESRDLITFMLPSGRWQYLRGPMGLSATSGNWCRGREIIDAKGQIIKNANDDNVDDDMIPYINEDDGKQPYSYVNSGKDPQRRVESDATYARKDLDLARSLHHNPAASAAAAAEASIMDVDARLRP
jgi:hypothetical protein